ncbi:MAG: hypothetical protein A2Y56_09175 [Candidatus Aminicenantes bacterium RBG_13_63_10]|nr:MAG: hypothetical protein A2Y56_09175 [Candidatus Aminicenantes bacterium RBG_13_63_10]
MRQARFDHLGVFTYSAEEGTPAFALGDPVSEEEKTSRRGELMSIQQAISLEKNRGYVGRRLEVLVEKALGGASPVLIGRGHFQAPEVDGVIRLRTGGNPAEALHAVRQVEITGAGVYDLRGRLRE